MARIVEEKEFKKHIFSKNPVNIYVILGDENYLIDFYTKDLVKKLVGESPSEFSYHEFFKKVDLNSLLAAVGTVPFMTEYNCVLVKDMDFSDMIKDEYDDLVKILKSVPDSTVLIFEFSDDKKPKKSKESDQGSDDKKSKKSKESDQDSEEEKKRNYFKLFCNQVEKLGIVAEINMRSAVSLEHQVASWADKMGKKLSLPLASRLIYYCGTDLTILHSELDKVCAYTGDSDEITIEMIEAVVTKKLEAKVYDLTDHIVAGNLSKAHFELQGLYALREDPRNILRTIGFVYVDLYRARVTTESGEKMADTADFFKCSKRLWALNKAVKKTEYVSTDSLRESLKEIADLSEKFNKTSLNEEAAVENLVTKLSIIAGKEASYA